MPSEDLELVPCAGESSCNVDTSSTATSRLTSYLTFLKNVTLSETMLSESSYVTVVTY